MMRQQIKASDVQEQLASGKRVITSGDDPVASIYIQNFSQQDKQLDLFLNGINLARNRQTRAEINMSDAETLTDSAKRQVLEMINGSLSGEGRKAHQEDLRGIFNNFMNLVNSRDESGNYLFSGTQITTQPFHRERDNSVSYAGDDYFRKAQIGASVEVQTTDPGDKLFMEIKNPFGDYQPEYTLTSGSDLLLSSAKNTDNTDVSEYKVSFVDNNGATEYQLYKDGALVSNGRYDSKQGVSYGSLNMSFKGEIAIGDSITLQRQESFNIFDTFKRGMEYAVASIFDASATAELQQVVEEFSAAYVHFSQARAQIGTRLNLLDTQENNHEDLKLVLNRSLSAKEDLDYPSAVIQLNEDLLALKASQQAFAKTKDLTLFNYV